MYNIKELIINGVKIHKQNNYLYFLIIFTLIFSFVCLALSFKTKDSNIYIVKNNQIERKSFFSISPSRSQSVILNNVKEAVFETLNFDSYNYETKLNTALNNWFTEDGANSFAQSLFNKTIGGADYTIIEYITKYKLTLQTYVMPDVTIVKASRNKGYLTWQVVGNIVITYRKPNGNVVSNQNRSFSAIIVERDTRYHPSGLGIESFNII